jgi:hypothetical protein
MKTSAKVTSIVAIVLGFALSSFASAPVLTVTAPRQAHSGGTLVVTYSVTRVSRKPQLCQKENSRRKQTPMELARVRE